MKLLYQIAATHLLCMLALRVLHFLNIKALIWVRSRDCPLQGALLMFVFSVLCRHMESLWCLNGRATIFLRWSCHSCKLSPVLGKPVHSCLVKWRFPLALPAHPFVYWCGNPQTPYGPLAFCPSLPVTRACLWLCCAQPWPLNLQQLCVRIDCPCKKGEQWIFKSLNLE